MTHENINEMNTDQQIDEKLSGLDELANRTTQIKNHLCEFNEIITQVVDENQVQSSYEQRMETMIG